MPYIEENIHLTGIGYRHWIQALNI